MLFVIERCTWLLLLRWYWPVLVSGGGPSRAASFPVDLCYFQYNRNPHRMGNKASSATPPPPPTTALPNARNSGGVRAPSALFRALNPELFVRPNLTVGLLGTAAFLGASAYLLYENLPYLLHSPPPTPAPSPSSSPRPTSHRLVLAATTDTINPRPSTSSTTSRSSAEGRASS